MTIISKIMASSELEYQDRYLLELKLVIEEGVVLFKGGEFSNYLQLGLDFWRRSRNSVTQEQSLIRITNALNGGIEGYAQYCIDEAQRYSVLAEHLSTSSPMFNMGYANLKRISVNWCNQGYFLSSNKRISNSS